MVLKCLGIPPKLTARHFPVHSEANSGRLARDKSKKCNDAAYEKGRGSRLGGIWRYILRTRHQPQTNLSGYAALLALNICRLIRKALNLRIIS
jgi:hypothetical protein